MQRSLLADAVVIALAAAATLSAPAAFAQATSGTTSSGTVVTTQGRPKIGASQNADVMRHRDATGKPCVSIYGWARPYSGPSKLFDHLVAASNSCAQLITVQVCYYRTQQCIAMEIPGRGRREMILGTAPSIKDFSFEFRERFWR